MGQPEDEAEPFCVKLPALAFHLKSYRAIKAREHEDMPAIHTGKAVLETR